MARLPYLEPDQVAPEYRDMLKRNTNLQKLLVNSPDMARAFSGLAVEQPAAVKNGFQGKTNSLS